MDYTAELSAAREDCVISTVIVVPGVDLNFNDRKCIFKSYANNFNWDTYPFKALVGV